MLVWHCSSSGLPEEDGDSPYEKVNHICCFETDVRAELLADYALPVRMEMLIEVTFQLEGDFGHLLLLLQSGLRELNCLEFQV